MFKIFIFSVVSLFAMLSGAPAEEPEMLCLSFPRSGTHWTLYCLSILLEKNIIFDRGMSEVEPFMGKLGLLNNGNIYAAHNPKDLWIKKDHNSRDYLILILRNYREAMLRNMNDNAIDVIKTIKAWKDFDWLDKNKKLCYIQYRNSYINNIRCFDKWDEDKRILIYLEDLIDNPDKVLANVLSKFERDYNPDKLENFLQNIESHAQACLGIYSSQGGSKSKGKDHLYHTKKIGNNYSKKIDKTMKENFPYYFNKYLKRYEIH